MDVICWMGEGIDIERGKCVFACEGRQKRVIHRCECDGK